MGWDKTMGVGVEWLLLMIMLVGFIGMLEVAIQLSDPFGDDDCDLPVEDYIKYIMSFMARFIEDESELKISKVPKNFKTDYEKDPNGQQVYWAREHLGERYFERLDQILSHNFITARASAWRGKHEGRSSPGASGASTPKMMAAAAANTTASSATSSPNLTPHMLPAGTPANTELTGTPAI